MRLIYLKTRCWMTLRELVRNRILLILLIVIPTIFYAITRITTLVYDVYFKLAAVSEKTYVQVNLRAEALVFIGLAAIGLLSGFLALNLIQKNEAVNRRLIICRYLPAFYPAQVSMISAFTDYSIIRPCLASIIYGTIFLVLALFIFWHKIHIYRQSQPMGCDFAPAGEPLGRICLCTKRHTERTDEPKNL